MRSFLSSPALDLPSAPLLRHRWRALGTVCELQFAAQDPAAATEFIAAAQAWVEAFEARYSRFRADSELSRINRGAGRHWVEVDGEMEQMLGLCAMIHFETGGLLDPTALPVMRLWDYRVPRTCLPSEEEIAGALALVGWEKVQRRPGAVFLPRAGMELDFGGWGKEFAVDAVAQIARNLGLTRVLVDFGHDLHVSEAPEGRPAWHVGLEDPDTPGRHRGSIAVRNRGVASSGDYLRGFTLGRRRYGHIVDPRTGRPVANGCRQVTVVAPSCLQAGVLSTSAFILGGEAGLRRIQDTYGADGLIVADRVRYQTRGFSGYVVEN